MKDWEIQKVNELFKRMDALQEENFRLKSGSNAESVVSKMSATMQQLSDRLDNISDSVQSVIDKLDDIKCECKPTPARSTKAAVKKK